MNVNAKNKEETVESEDSKIYRKSVFSGLKTSTEGLVCKEAPSRASGLQQKKLHHLDFLWSFRNHQLSGGSEKGRVGPMCRPKTI